MNDLSAPDRAPNALEKLNNSGGGLVAAFTLTTFLSALLLFSIQPLFAKMVLPVLGGSPSVWAVAMCFFQGALLAGYCYAHLLNTYVPSRQTGYIHLAVCTLALLALPIGLPEGWREPPPGEPYFWQLGLFTLAVGAPFLAVAANAPLLQAWFAATGHPDGRDPYFMYAASNLGSLIALLGYPFVLEPAFGLSQASRIWTAGFVILMAALALCFVMLRQSSGQRTAPAESVATDGPPAAPPTTRQRLGWVGLALVPSALLTAFTTHVATDVASAPLIWVMPLALYLLTFVLVFRDRALIPTQLLLVLHLAAVVLALLQLSQTKHDGWFVSSAVGVAAFFTSAMVAHRTLYEARPSARYLTEFYLWMSLGGVLGGLFAALIAPRLFSEVFEYPLLLALTMACRPGALDIRLQDRDELMRLWLILAGGLLAIFWAPWAAGQLGLRFGDWGVTPALALTFAALVMLFMLWPPRQLAAALLMFLTIVMLPSSVKRGDAERSYFGVYRVKSDGDFNYLTHGTTLHGAQRIRDTTGAYVVDTTPATYYHPRSPMARTVEIMRRRLEAQGRKGRYGVIGLGTGSLACYAAEGETWRFFEIDPVVVNIASTPENFSFLSNCLPKPEIVLGDARLKLAKEPDQSFDLIIVDAFSSDAVPVHLMTAEAMQLYMSKLKPDGVALLHISNRYLDLDAVVGATAPAIPGMDGVLVSDDESDGSYATSTSTVALLSRSAEALADFRSIDDMTVKEFDGEGLPAWTDDYSDILGPLLAKRRH
jgi:hypothetical protein